MDADKQEVWVRVRMRCPPSSPAISPPRSPTASPERPRVDLSTRVSPGALISIHDHNPGLDWGTYEVASDGGHKVLADNEYHRAVLVSHNRRDPAALNLVYTIVWALRTARDPGTQMPFSKHCHKDSRRVELWLDKEQLAERGGSDWNEPILRAMREGIATVFCVGNAFCGSNNCVKEVSFAAHKRFAPLLPVFIERLCNDEAAFESWKQERAAVPGGPDSLFDCNARTFRDWRNKADNVEFYLDLQGVPPDNFKLAEFVCPLCAGTKDSACRACCDWRAANERAGSGTKLVEAVRQLGKYIDCAVEKKMDMDSSVDQKMFAEHTGLALLTGQVVGGGAGAQTPAPAEPGPHLEPAATDVGGKSSVELKFEGSVGSANISEELLQELRLAVMDALLLEGLEELEVDFGDITTDTDLDNESLSILVKINEKMVHGLRFIIRGGIAFA
eukprot:COSAG05_NODE_906_length_6646_cov_15.962426_2_plen_446_part_00